MSTKKLTAYYAIGFLGWGLVYYSLMYEPRKENLDYVSTPYSFSKNQVLEDSLLIKSGGLENKLSEESNFK